MSDQNEDKGFKVVDKRSMSDAEREAERQPSVPVGDKPEAGHPDAPVSAGVPGETSGEQESAHEHGRGIAPPAFLDLLQSLQFSAMHHLGMVQGEDGQRSAVDLPAAQDAIDMMGMLKEKTKGNLTAEEDGVLTEGLYVLRMSFLAARNAAKPGGGKE